MTPAGDGLVVADDMATAEVSSDRLSRQCTVRPPQERRKEAAPASVTATWTPRAGRASSTIRRAEGFSPS